MVEEAGAYGTCAYGYSVPASPALFSTSLKLPACLPPQSPVILSWPADVCAHAYTPAAIARAVRCGVRSIEHGNCLDEETAGASAYGFGELGGKPLDVRAVQGEVQCFAHRSSEDGSNINGVHPPRPPPAIPIAALLAERGAFLVPTLVTYAALAEGGEAAGMQPELVAKVGGLMQQVRCGALPFPPAVT